MTASKIDQAREWVRDNIDDFYEGERVYAVCEVIESLPDQWADTEKIQKWYDQVEGLLPYWARDDFKSLLTP